MFCCWVAVIHSGSVFRWYFAYFLNSGSGLGRIWVHKSDQIRLWSDLEKWNPVHPNVDACSFGGTLYDGVFSSSPCMLCRHLLIVCLACYRGVCLCSLPRQRSAVSTEAFSLRLGTYVFLLGLRSPFFTNNTHTHNRFTALLEFVRDYPGEQVPER